MSGKRKMMNPYFLNNLLLRRIDKYVVDCPGEIDREDLVENLRLGYKEYERKNKHSFRMAVFKAYDLLKEQELLMDEATELEQQTMEDTTSSTEPKQKILKKSGGQNELINISSDESDLDESQDLKVHIDPTKFPELRVVNSNRVEQPAPNQKKHPRNALKRGLNGKSDSQDVTETLPGRYFKKKKFDPLKNPFREGFDIRKLKKNVFRETVPTITFKDFGGYPKVIETVENLVLHFKRFEIFAMLGVTPLRGFLLHGPPGCGKTLLANAIAGELGIPLVSTTATELIGGMSGESEQKIRDLFARGKCQSPCIIFIDEIDSISQPRELSRKDMERRMVTQLISCLDDLGECEEGNDVIVIGATNRIESLDPSLRRAGRFDREVSIGIPDFDSRHGILKLISKNIRLSELVNLEELAKSTPGFVAADIKSLFTEAGIAAVKRIMAHLSDKERAIQANGIIDLVGTPDGEVKEVSKAATGPSKGKKQKSKDEEEAIIVAEEEEEEDEIEEEADCEIVEKFSMDDLKAFRLGPDDFALALKSVQPSSKREGFATVPDVTWDDVGSLKEIRQELNMSILMPVKYPREFAEMGIVAPSGILLCGPPGCGKTLLAKAIANEANINFLSVKGPELLNMYVGESEKAVRQCFQRAKNSSPCVIFFDEIDALCPKRSDSNDTAVGSRVVNQLLTEMDGVEGRIGVYMMAATNRPDIVDPAVMRPGRFDKVLYVGIPTTDDRADILRALTKNGTCPRLSSDVSLAEIALDPSCTGYTGADLSALVKESSIIALTERLSILEAEAKQTEKKTLNEEMKHDPILVTTVHFKQALARVLPSVSNKDQKRYQLFKYQLSRQNKRSEDEEEDTEMEIAD